MESTQVTYAGGRPTSEELGGKGNGEVLINSPNKTQRGRGKGCRAGVQADG